MKVLDKKDGKLLLGKLTMSRHRDDEQGFFVEIDESKVPKKLLESLKIGGGGYTHINYINYFFSNTAGETLHKWFKQVEDRIKFHLKNDDELKQLNNETDFEKGINLIAKSLEYDKDNLKFRFNYWKYDYFREETNRDYNRIECQLKLKIDKDDFLNYPHPYEDDPNFEEYRKFFIGRDTASISFRFEFPIEYEQSDHEGLKKLRDLLLTRDRDYNISDINELLEGSNNHKWRYSVDINNTFYGNR